MRRFIFIMVIVLLLSAMAVGCEPASGFKTKSTESSAESTVSTKLEFSYKSDGELVSTVSKTEFSAPIEFDFNGSNIILDTPRFTGLPVDSVYSYKDYYYFSNGCTVFQVASSDGLIYCSVDKAGKIVNSSSNFADVKQKTDVSEYLPKKTDSQTDVNDRLIGDGLVIHQVGEPGKYVQYLYSSDGTLLSDGYDSIGYFYNGIALIQKGNKIGLIDENGNELLSPTVSFDTVKYPPKDHEFDPTFIIEDAFILPIGGEFAVINIIR